MPDASINSPEPVNTELTPTPSPEFLTPEQRLRTERIRQNAEVTAKQNPVTAEEASAQYDRLKKPESDEEIAPPLSEATQEKAPTSYLSLVSALLAISLTVVPSALASAKHVIRLALRLPLSIMEIALRLTPDTLDRLSWEIPTS